MAKRLDRFDINRQMDEGGLSRRIGSKSGALDKRISPEEASAAAPSPSPAAAANAPVPDGAYDPRADANTLMDKQARLKELQDTPEQTAMGKLGSTGNLLKLGAAAAMALTGNAKAGAGFAIGTSSRATSDAQEANFKRQKQIDSLINQVDTLQDRLMGGLMQTPEAFVDPVTGENIIPSETIQDLLAINVPFNPAAILANAKEGKNDMAQYDVAGQMIQLGIQTKNPANVQLGLSIINDVGGMGWSPEYIKTLAYAEVSQIMRLLNEENEPASVLAAAKWSANNGVSMLSPGSLRLLKGKSKADGWKIDSIDDQIKVDAYKALEWYNDTWLNDKVDGIRNRERYANNPDEAIKMAFKQNPDAMIKIKKVFPATTHGDEVALIRLKALMESAALMPEMRMYLSGALTGTPQERLEALVEMAQSISNTSNAALGVITLDQRAGMAFTAGRRAAARLGYDNINQAATNQLGADVLSIAHKLALNDGIDNYWTSDTQTRMKYQKLAEEQFMLWQDGENINIPNTRPQTSAQTTEAAIATGEILDTTPEEEVTVEPKAASATQISALAKNEDDLKELYEKASNPLTNVKLPEGYRDALDEVEVFMSLPKDQRATLYDDPAFQKAIGVLQSVATEGITLKEAVDLLGQEAPNLKPLNEIRELQQTNPERAAKLARDKKYADALEWEKKMARISPEMMKKAKAAREREMRSYRRVGR